MDPLWSETCRSTFKYFIILIVSTNYIFEHKLDNKIVYMLMTYGGNMKNVFFYLYLPVFSLNTIKTEITKLRIQFQKWIDTLRSSKISVTVYLTARCRIPKVCPKVSAYNYVMRTSNVMLQRSTDIFTFYCAVSVFVFSFRDHNTFSTLK